MPTKMPLMGYVSKTSGSIWDVIFRERSSSFWAMLQLSAWQPLLRLMPRKAVSIARLMSRNLTPQIGVFDIAVCLCCFRLCC